MKTQRRPTSRDATHAASWAASWSPGEYQAPPFENVYSVAFDGTDDHATTSADDTLATKTYSFWAKSSNTGVNAIFDHGDYNIGGFFFNYDSGKPLLYLEANWFRYWNDNSAQDDGNWHHWLLLLNTNISDSKLFCDGVELTVQSTATGAGGGSSYTTGLRMARAGTNYFDGNLDEFAVFDGDKTSLASTLYNGGVPADLTGLSGLEHWWRMGDNDEGTGTTVTDQAGDENATLQNGAAFQEDVPS